jgi:hypothetical protein
LHELGHTLRRVDAHLWMARMAGLTDDVHLELRAAALTDAES